jgi:MOSC domain-containing protein YiiM
MSDGPGRSPSAGAAVREPADGQAVRPGRPPGRVPADLREGDVGAGDPVEVLDRPGHGITIAFVARAIFGDRELRTRALTAPRLAGSAVALLRERAA